MRTNRFIKAIDQEQMRFLSPIGAHFRNRLRLFLPLIVLVLSLLLISYAVQMHPQKGIDSNVIEHGAIVKQVKLLICNLNARGFSGWVPIENAEEIPYQRGDLKNPRNYAEQVQPPSVERVNNRAIVTLYTWTEQGGLLVKWTATVEGSKVTSLRGEVIQIAVGHHIALTTEGEPGGFLPTPGALLVNERIEDLNISSNLFSNLFCEIKRFIR